MQSLSLARALSLSLSRARSLSIARSRALALAHALFLTHTGYRWFILDTINKLAQGHAKEELKKQESRHSKKAK
jgi:hypothetical protein